MKSNCQMEARDCSEGRSGMRCACTLPCSADRRVIGHSRIGVLLYSCKNTNVHKHFKTVSGKRRKD